MKQNYLVKDQSATKIKAELIMKADKASLYYCEGDEVWVPHSVSRYDDKDKSILIQDWFYQKLEAEGKL